jgi:DNA-directed RNA polymerase specialized sigma24 family protein
MPDQGSISILLEQLGAGQDEALQALWQRYYARLVELACHRLRGRTRSADAEDVALSALDTFYRGVAQGRFPRLQDRDDLWQVLLLLIHQKAVNLLQHEHCRKRGGGQVQALSAVDAFVDCFGPEPTPAFAAEVADECQRLLDLLGDDELRAIAVARMEGYTNSEIAARLGCSVATVERRLTLIRKVWSRGSHETADP